MKLNGKTDIGCNRAENQDTFRSGEAAGAAWGIVCDGVGGAQYGKVASNVAADCMEELLYQQLRAGTADVPEKLLRDAVALANAEVYTRSGAGATMMGTTVVCALAMAGTLHLLHVGDSRAYVYEDGALAQLTRDHSMVQELVDAGSITPGEARTHPEKNVITRALGLEDVVEPTYGTHPLREDSLVLLCSDGLSNVVAESEMVRLMQEYDFWDLPRMLVNAALEEGGDDNITVMLMKPEKKDLPK